MPYKDKEDAKAYQRKVRESDKERLRVYAREYARARKAGIPWVNPVPKVRKYTKGRVVGTRVDIAGQKYGSLLALEFSRRETLGKGYVYLWKFLCNCGNVKEINRGNVTDGAQKTCGQCRGGVMLTPEGATRRSLYNSYKHRAHARGYEFSLKEDEFIAMTKMPCAICGLPPSQKFIQSHGKSGSVYFCLYTGIDRINNDLGYEEGNVRPCCKWCNLAKHAWTEEQFQDWLHRVIKFQNSEGPAREAGERSNHLCLVT